MAGAFQRVSEFWALAARKISDDLSILTRWSQYFDQMTPLCKSAMHMFDSRLSIAQSDQVNLEMFIAVSNWFRPFKGHIHHAFWLSRRAFVVYGTIEAPVLHVIGQQKKDLRWGRVWHVQARRGLNGQRSSQGWSDVAPVPAVDFRLDLDICKNRGPRKFSGISFDI
jgi:hypothetical protein